MSDCIPRIKTQLGSPPEAGVWAASSLQHEEKHVVFLLAMTEGPGDEAVHREFLPALSALESGE